MTLFAYEISIFFSFILKFILSFFCLLVIHFPTRGDGEKEVNWL